MSMDVNVSHDEGSVEACPLSLPLYGRVPGALALAAAVAGVFVQPVFFSLAGGLLSLLSLLLSPPRCRLLGLAGLVAALTVGAHAVLRLA